VRRAGLIALVLVTSCSLFHDDYPSAKCERDSDCFMGRERCNLSTKTCEALSVPDAAPPQPDAPPTPDAAPMPPDAAPVDVMP
jgi:hypothetical protein